MKRYKQDLNIQAALMTAQLSEAQMIEMSRELRELSTLSDSERRIWFEQEGNASFFGDVDSLMFREAREELFKMVN